MTGAGLRTARVTTGIALGASALLVMMAAPGVAADQATSEATASALKTSVAGKSVDLVSQFRAIYNGVEQVTSGKKLPLPGVASLATQDLISAGVLGQDAVAGNGTSSACAGLVARTGALSIGPNGSCVASGDGKVALSLGKLPKLGAEDLLSKLPAVPGVPGLPELPALPGLSDPTAALPDAELRLVARSVYASCSASPRGAKGGSQVADAKLVAVVAGQTITVADVPETGLTLSHQDLLAKLRGQLPEQAGLVLGHLDGLLAKVPAAKLPGQDAVVIKLGQQVKSGNEITVTALQAKVGVPTGLSDKLAAKLPKLPKVPSASIPANVLKVSVGKVNCGSQWMYSTGNKATGNKATEKAAGTKAEDKAAVTEGKSPTVVDDKADAQAALPQVPGLPVELLGLAEVVTGLFEL